MGLFLPHEKYLKITGVDLEALKQKGIKAIILDVDNTLTTHGNPTCSKEVLDWLQKARNAQMKLMLLSNNQAERVAPFARLVGLDYEAKAAKPLKKGILHVCERMGVAPGEAAMIGDQIFTDILGGRRAGAYCILVDPIELEKGFFFMIKRFFEKPILRRFKEETIK